jgi:hypothetical protein
MSSIDGRYILVGASGTGYSATKDVSDTFRYTVDYGAWLNGEDNLVSVSVPAVTGITITNAQVASGDDTLVQFLVAGGTAGTKYSIIIRATTAAGQVKQIILALTIRSTSV